MDFVERSIWDDVLEMKIHQLCKTVDMIVEKFAVNVNEQIRFFKVAQLLFGLNGSLVWMEKF